MWATHILFSRNKALPTTEIQKYNTKGKFFTVEQWLIFFRICSLLLLFYLKHCFHHFFWIFPYVEWLVDTQNLVSTVGKILDSRHCRLVVTTKHTLNRFDTDHENFQSCTHHKCDKLSFKTPYWLIFSLDTSYWHKNAKFIGCAALKSYVE